MTIQVRSTSSLLATYAARLRSLVTDGHDHLRVLRDRLGFILGRRELPVLLVRRL